ncbi:DUF397 domain-containing protein [Streptomyces phaeochromogenes]|nr:DUF397 domain-containing protein [Streptomyces phaeochromogenes]
MQAIDWQKSTYSGDGSNCVYVAATSTGAVHLCESDDAGIILSTTRHHLSVLIRTLKESPPMRGA